jgi:hypothetical protein
MSMRSWIRSLFAPATRPIRKAPRRNCLGLEALEDRTVPSTFTVLNTNDSGDGSLSDAITQAQSGAHLNVADTIVFNNNPSLGTNFYDGTQHTIPLAGGQFDLTDAAATTLSGPGANLLSISGGGRSRVFDIHSGASAELSGLTIKDGSAPEAGGGLFNEGTVTLTDCTVSGNVASASTGIGGGVSYGGGMWNYGTVTLTNCTVSANSALNGGGILTFGRGTATLTNCTISGNNAGGGGGGVFSSGTTTLTNCTVSGNSAGFGGGGIFNAYGAVTLNNTIVAGQTFGEDVTNFGGTITGSHNLIGGDPMLGPLADNGGPTQTMALLPGSPAIDAGNNLLAVDAQGNPLTTDQRGFARIGGGTVDIGAFEVQHVRLLEATASSQGTINIGSNGSIVLHLAVAAGQLSGSDTVASLFNGVNFTIAIQKADGKVTYGTLQSTAQVDGNGNINVTLQMNDALKADLYDAYVKGGVVNFDITATSRDGNYAINADTLSKLLNNGAFKYVV